MSNASSQMSSLESRQRQASQAQRTMEAKTAFVASLTSAGASIDTELQERAKNIHANDKALTKQEKDLRNETQRLAKQNDTMQKFVDKSNKQLATFDNLEPIQADLEQDLDELEELLRMIEEEAKQQEHNDVEEE